MSIESSRRRTRAALLLAPALALALLPRLSGIPAAHAAPVHPIAQVKHAHVQQHHVKSYRARIHLVHPFAVVSVPPGPAVVTNCSAAGYNAPGGLGTALNNGNVITFACNPALSGAKVGGTYVIVVPQTDSPAIDIGANTLSIDGTDGGANDVAIDGGSTSATTGVQIFFADDGSSLRLANLTLQNGNAQGNSDDGIGGAVEIFGNFSAANDAFLNNTAADSGGALELGTSSSSSATVQDTITNSTFIGNVAGAGWWGGAIDIGGGEGEGAAQTVTISYSTFTNNSALAGDDSEGGAIELYNCHPASVNIDHSVFDGNTASDDGGAIDNDCDNLTLTDSLVTNNSAGYGGGIADESGYTGTLIRDTFSGNTALAGGDGGALYADNSPEIVANSTFTGNIGGYGAAIYNDATLTLIADTIAGNTVPATVETDASAAAGLANDGTVTVQSTILANNLNLTAGPTTVVNCSGTITDHGYNLEYSDGSAPTCGFTNGSNGDIVGQDPLLGAPMDNGGPSIGATGAIQGLPTMALGAGSPAIGQVTDPTVCQQAPVNDVDERSLPRHSALRGVCDSGAYDTGDDIVNPGTIAGTIQFPTLPGHLGFFASSHNVNLGYITFQDGPSRLIVNQANLEGVSCPNQCIGLGSLTMPNLLIPNITAKATINGDISSGWGNFKAGQDVKVIFSITTSPRSAMTGLITVAVTAVEVQVYATDDPTVGPPFVDVTQTGAPFPGLSKVIFQPY